MEGRGGRAGEEFKESVDSALATVVKLGALGVGKGRSSALMLTLGLVVFDALDSSSDESAESSSDLPNMSCLSLVSKVSMSETEVEGRRECALELVGVSAPSPSSLTSSSLPGWSVEPRFGLLVRGLLRI